MMLENLSTTSLLDAVASPLLICQNDTILFANTAAEKLIGYSCAELQSRKIESLIYSTSANVFSTWYCADGDSKRSIPLNIRLATANQSLIWVKMTATDTSFNGQSVRLITMQDITTEHQTETELYFSKTSRDMLLTSFPDVVMVTDFESNLIYISPSVERTLGYVPNMLLGKKWADKIHPDDRLRTIQASAELRRTNTQVTVETRILNARGEYIWFECVAGIVIQEHSEQTSIISTVRNIHKHKLTEFALLEREQRLRIITDNMRDIVLETTPEGIIRYASPSCTAIMGYQPEELYGKLQLDQIHPDEITLVLEYFRQVITTPSLKPLDMRFKHKDGHYVWVEINCSIVTDETGGLQSLVISARAIAERKAAQAALQQSQHLLEQIMETTPTGIYLFDAVLIQCIFYNQKVTLGYPEVEIKQSPESFFRTRVHPDDYAIFDDSFDRLKQAKDGEVIVTECRMKHANGEWHWFQYHDTVFARNNSGQPTQYLRTGYDITQRINVEASLRQSQDMLKKITDTAPFGVYIYDVKQRRDIYHNKRLIEEINPKEITEVPEEDFYASYVHPEDLKIHQDHRKHLMNARDGEIIESELRALNSNGKYEWLYFRDIVFARDEDGKPSQFLGSMQDITERKQAEQSLRESQNLLKQITETVPLDIYIYDVDLHRNIFFNRTENMGYPNSVLDSQPSGDFYSSLVHPDDIEQHRENAKRLLTARDGELLHAEYRMKHASGEWRWYDFRDIVFVRHEDGTPRQFLGSVQDITARKQTEEALRQSQEVLEQVTSTVPMYIYIFDVDLDKGIFANHTSILGFDDRMSLDGGSGFYRNLVHPDDLALYDDFDRRLATSPDGAYVEGEFRMRHIDGSWIWRNYRSIVLHRHADGTPSQYLGTVEDITQRKTVEAALLQSQHMFQQVAETVPMQIFIYDYDLQRNVFENRPSDLKYPLETITTASQDFFTNLVHPEDRPLHDEIMQKLLTAQDGQMLENEFRMRAADGTYAWRNYRYIPFARRPDGSLSQFLGSILNVDERRKASDALSENEEKLRLITDNIHDLVALTDVNLHYRYATPSHRIILGYDPQDLIGKSVFDLVHPDDIEMVRNRAVGALEKRQPESVEFRFRHRDGYYLWLETNGSFVSGVDGQVTGAVFASRDVSERRWMQRAMLEQEKLLVMLQKEQELSALKTRMMSRLSHELRTPLAVISTSADLLDSYANRMTEVQRAERLQQIRGQVRHFTSMLDNMALVVKGISYSLEFAPAPYDFQQIAFAVINELKALLRVQHDVQIQLEGDGLPVNSDEQLMRLILTHLLSNAMKYSPPSKPIIVKGSLSETAITLEVKDQGMGILTDDLDRIFEPFFRGMNIGEVPGLGVGLSIVKDAVDSMQGSITVNSDVNVGTTVTVVIPLGGVIGVN